MQKDIALAGFSNLFGLIGYPLGHSFSQRYFREKFSREGLEGYEYGLFPLETIQAFPELLRMYPNLRGLNVTIPYKESVMSLLDAIDESAQSIGAVNVIRIQNGRTTGYNSDVVGFSQSLEQFLGPAQADISKALVLGTGGAAKAVLYVLKKLNIESTLVSRDSAKADLTYAQIDESVLAQHRLIINTTPLGMAPNVETAPELPYSLLTNRHYLYDLVYNPLETKFMKLGLAQGAFVQNGLDMLYGQAERAWEIWME